MMLKVSNPEKIKGSIEFELYGEKFMFQSEHTVYIPLHNDEIAVVGLSDNASTLTRKLLRNFDLLRNVTGLTLTLLPAQSGN